MAQGSTNHEVRRLSCCSRMYLILVQVGPRILSDLVLSQSSRLSGFGPWIPAWTEIAFRVGSILTLIKIVRFWTFWNLTNLSGIGFPKASGSNSKSCVEGWFSASSKSSGFVTFAKIRTVFGACSISPPASKRIECNLIGCWNAVRIISCSSQSDFNSPGTSSSAHSNVPSTSFKHSVFV